MTKNDLNERSNVYSHLYHKLYLWVPADTCRYLHGYPQVLAGTRTLQVTCDIQVPDPLRQVTRGNLSVRIRIGLFENKIPAGRIWIHPWVNSWCSLHHIDPNILLGDPLCLVGPSRWGLCFAIESKMFYWFYLHETLEYQWCQHSWELFELR